MSENIFPETAALIAHARTLPDGNGQNNAPLYRNLGALVTERAAAHPHKNWLTFCDDEGNRTTYTYAEFSDATRRVAALMENGLGLGAGDRVATLLVNDPRTVLVYFGAWLLGVTVVPLNIGEDDARVGFILDNSQAKVVFAEWAVETVATKAQSPPSWTKNSHPNRRRPVS